MNTRRFSIRAAFAAAAAAALISGAAWRGLAAGPPAPAVASPQVPAVTGRSLAAGTRDSYADVVKAVAPAVVTIRVEGKATPSPTDFQGGDDFFRRFFGDDEDQPRQRAIP